MKEQIKAVLKEMIKNGEIKVGVEWVDLWSELYLTISIDDEELVNESVFITGFKSKDDDDY